MRCSRNSLETVQFEILSLTRPCPLCSACDLASGLLFCLKPTHLDERQNRVQPASDHPRFQQMHSQCSGEAGCAPSSSAIFTFSVHWPSVMAAVACARPTSEALGHRKCSSQAYQNACQQTYKTLPNRNETNNMSLQTGSCINKRISSYACIQRASMKSTSKSSRRESQILKV